MSNYHQRAIYKILGDKIVAYHPYLAKVLGSVNSGILIAQLLYWKAKGRDKEWTYKTMIEMYEETGLTRRQQETAIKACKQKGILRIKLAGIPAKRHFNVDIEKLINLINDDNLVCTNRANKVVLERQSIPKNTSKISADKLKELEEKKKFLNRKFDFPE